MANVVETLYRFKNDRAAAQAVLRDQKRITDAVEDTDRASERLADAYSTVERTAQKAANAQIKAAEAQAKAARESATLYGDVESRTRALSGAVGYIGGGAGQKVEQTVNVGAEVLASVEAIGLLRQEFPKFVENLNVTRGSLVLLGTAVVAAGAAYVAFGDDVKGWIKAAQESREAVKGQINALKEFNSFIQTATSEQVAERINAVKDEAAANRSYLEDLNDLKAALEQGLDTGNRASFIEQASEGAVRALDKLGIMGVGLKDLDQAISEANVAIEANDTEFRMLVDAYSSGATATNDARIAQEKLAATLMQNWEQDAARQIELEDKKRSATSETIQNELDALADRRKVYEDQIALLQAIPDETGAAAERIADLTLAISDLETQEQQLADQVMPVVRAREAEVEALKAQEEALKDLEKAQDEHAKSLEDIAALQSEVADANQARLDAEQEYADKSLEITQERERKRVEEEADFARKRLRDIADFYADLADKDADYYRDRADLLDDLAADIAEIGKDRAKEAKDLNRDLEDLARDHGKRMRDIQRSADQEIQGAAMRLDAISIRETQKRAEQDLADERENYAEQKNERETQYREAMALLDQELRERKRAAEQALRDLEEQHQRERQRQIAEFQQRLAREDQDRAVRLQRQNEQYAREDAQRLAQYNDALAKLAQHHANLRTQLQQFYDDLFTIHVAGLNKITMATQTTYGHGGYQDYPTYQTGGYTPGGLVRTHPGEFVLNPNTTRMMEAGVGQRLTQSNVMHSMSTSNGPITVNITAPSGDAGDIRTAVLDVFGEILG